MYRLWLLTVLLLISSSCITTQASYTDEEGDQQLWGPIKTDQLQEAPYAEWYTASYGAYEPSDAILEWKEELKAVKVQAFLGTWCSDSQEWVPQLVHLWTALDLPQKKLQLIGLHNDGDLRKKGPNGEEEGLNIEYVPTFIFSLDGQEIGRIVEYPLTTLEGDVIKLAKQVREMQEKTEQ